MEVQEILNLKKGNLVVFEKIVGEPMCIVVGDRLMARGEIVVVNERYGVRISEVPVLKKRLESVENRMALFGLGFRPSTFG